MDEVTTNQVTASTLYAKMSRVMGQLDRIPKNGFNEHFRYAFVTDADVVDAVRTAMSSEGLAFFASMDSIHQEERQGKRGTFVHTIVNIKLTFADGESGNTMSVNWKGEANDSQDKGVAKAATSAVKYALLKTFLISTGDDPDSDNDGPDEEGKVEKKLPTPKKAVPRKKVAPKKKIVPNSEKGPQAVKVWLLTEAQMKVDGGRTGPPTLDAIKKLAPTLNGILGGDDERHTWTQWVYGKESLKEITGAQSDVLWTNLKATYDNGKWTSTNEKFVAAIKAMYKQALLEQTETPKDSPAEELKEM